MDAAAWDERYRSTDHLWSVEPNLFVADRLRTVTPGTGVDLAGGEGRNAIWLASLGWKMISVDFSEEAAARGAKRGSDVEFVVADISVWEPSGEVDLVLIAYLHLGPEEFASVLERSRTWLRPGGEMFLIGHDVSNLEEGYGGPQYPELLWDVDAILEHLKGLTIVEAQVVRRPVVAEEASLFARDALVRVRRPSG